MDQEGADGVTLRQVDPSEPADPGANPPRRTGRRVVARVGAGLAFAAAGFLGVASWSSSDGTDLRAERHTDLTGLVRAQAQDNQALARTVSELRADVDELGETIAGAQGDRAHRAVDELATPAGMEPMAGPGVVVTLDDAPSSARSAEVDPDALVVHQQDIQAVVNALWAGGAEALSIQGQRIVSTSAIRCVGNSVVLHGVPYPPPYVITAIGAPAELSTALNEAPGVRVYLEYVERFGLGYQLSQHDEVEIPGFEGSLDLEYARPIDS